MSKYLISVSADDLDLMPQEYRLRVKTMFTEEDGCWISMYRAHTAMRSAPRFYWKDYRGLYLRMQHRRVLYYFLHGVLPDRLQAECEALSCVNPDHMIDHPTPPPLGAQRASCALSEEDQANA